MAEPTRELDTVIAELVAAATTGGGVDPHHLAQELGAAGVTSPEALKVVEQLMAKLVDADQKGKPVDAMELAGQLGAIRAAAGGQESAAPAVSMGQVRYRCEQCGTMQIEATPPTSCPKCKGTKFGRPDLDQPNVESGAG